MVERSFHFHDVERWLSNIYVPVLRILYTKFCPISFVNTIPSSSHLLKIATIFSDWNAYLIVIEYDSIKVKEVNEVLTKIYIVRPIIFVFLL